MRKLMTLVMTTFIGMIFLLFPFQYSKATGGPLGEVSSYRIFYGAPTEKIIQKMQQEDLVIIEPYHYTVDQVRAIKEKGTLVFGYISTMEVPNWNTALVNKLDVSDFFYRNGAKIHFPKWDSYLMDITSSHYQEVLLSEIESQIIAKEFDGIFLDTVGDIDDQHNDNEDILKEQRMGMKQFLVKIKEIYPTKLLIQNWGFDTLMTTTAPFVDGVMWENFDYPVIAKDEWSLSKIEDLKKLQQAFTFKVLTVSFETKRKSQSYSTKQGFIHFHTNKGYDVWER